MFGGGTSTPFGSPPAGGAFGQPPATGFGAASTPFGGGGGAGATNASPFGAAASTPGGFGAPSTGGFGTGGSTFGSTTPGGGFGAPSTGGFGATTTTSSPFGAPSPAPSAFGAATTPGFGGTPGTSAFGTPAPAAGGFGTNTFGTTNATPGTSTFGGGTGGFGATTQPSTFGQPSTAFGTTGGFGSSPAPAPTPGLFGAPAAAPSTGLFGAPSPAASTGFGTPATSAFGTGAAGQPTGQPPAWAAGQPQQGGGTTQVPFNPITRSDGTGTIHLQTITALPAYERFSVEELRLQDYAMGNRGSAAAGVASTPSPGLFGAAPAAPSAFGTPAPAGGGLFGAPAASPFAPTPAASAGFGGTSTFGSAAPAAPFGSASPAPAFGAAPAPAFGAAPAPAFGAAPSTGVFGQPAKPPATGGFFGGGSTFGSTTPAPAPAGGGLFGSAPAPAPTGGLFGAPAPAAGGGLFGAPAPSTPGFGAPAAPAPTGGLFGTPAPAAGGGLFGTPAPGPTGFGAVPAPAPGGGLFGGAAPAPAGGFFGAPAPAAPSAFGLQPAGGTGFGTPGFGQPSPATPAPTLVAQQPIMVQPPPAMIHPTGNIMPPATNELVAAQLAAMEEKRKEMEKNDNFHNQPLASSTVSAATQSESSAARNLSVYTQRPSYPVYQASPSPSHTMIRPRGFASPPENGVTSHSLSNLSGGRPMAAPQTVASTAPTRLTINPLPKPKLKLTLTAANDDNSKDTPDQPKMNGTNPVTTDNGGANGRSPSQSTAAASDTSRRTEPVSTPEPSVGQKSHVRTPTSEKSTASRNGVKSAIRNVGFEHYQKAAGLTTEDPISTMNGRPADKSGLKVSPTAPKLSKAGYSCKPSLSELQQMSPEDLASVVDFSVERDGVGKVEWEGAVDVRYADLDSIVIIEPTSIQVYAEEEASNTKPALGTKLNRPAVLTMRGIFPPEGSDPAKFADKVARRTEKMGSTLIEYDGKKGDWILRVPHFSKYSLDDDDDDDGDVTMNTTPSPKARVVPLRETNKQEKYVSFTVNEDGQKKELQKKRRGTPFKPSIPLMSMASPQVSSSDDDDTDVDEVAVMETEDEILEAAETALNQMEFLNAESRADEKTKYDTDVFPEEADELDDMQTLSGNAPSISASYRFALSQDDMTRASNGPSFTDRIIKSVQGSKTTNSSIDFGRSMGKSFRVGFCPDGSFISIGKDGRIMKRRPVFAANEDDYESMLQTQLQLSRRVKTSTNCPVFEIDNKKRSGQADPLERALTSLAESTASADGKDAFMLLDVLRQKNSMNLPSKGADSAGQRRAIESITQWLVSSTSDDVKMELSKSNYDVGSMILSAVSSGDLDLASEVAFQNDHMELAVLISSCGLEEKTDILGELDAWSKAGINSKVPRGLLRAYHILAGNESLEDTEFQQKNSNPQFDWRRRMLMNLVYASKVDKNLMSILQDFEIKITEKKVPFPTPRYMGQDASERVESVLYRLLQYGAGSPSLAYADIFDPLGYTSSPTDHSLGFQLAACLKALSSGSTSDALDVIDCRTILDGFTSHLVAKGHWELAVFISLCSLNPDRSLASVQEQEAKKLVLKHFDGDPQSRSFLLESLGVPEAWLIEALSTRAAMKGDLFEYLDLIAKLDMKEASKIIEEKVVSNILFVDGQKSEQLLWLLDLVSVPGSLSKVGKDLFDIHDTIQSLDQCTEQQRNDEVESLLEACDDIQATLKQFKASSGAMKEGPAASKTPMAGCTVDTVYFISQAMRHATLFKLQLTGIKHGKSMNSPIPELLQLFARTKPSEVAAMDIDTSTALRAFM